MNITVVKEELLKLYKKSLFLSEEYTYHPIRLIQAVKSIIGINIDDPIDNLLDFCKEYTNKYNFIEKVNYKNKELDFPAMVSYKSLEESLLNEDLEKTYSNIYYLTTVSEGMQVIEFLLEYSLKYSKNSYSFIWSIYRMMLFTDKKDIFKSLLLCADALIKNKLLIKFNYKEFEDMRSIKWQRIQNDEFELIAVIFSLYHSKLIRKETINKYISKLLGVKDLKVSFDKSAKRDIDRMWIHSYFKDLSQKDIKVEDVLYHDAVRSVIKCANENNFNKIEIEKLNAVK